MNPQWQMNFLLSRALNSGTRANWRLGGGAREIPTGPRAGMTLLTDLLDLMVLSLL